MKKIPTAKMITITKKAQDMLKIFESVENKKIKETKETKKSVGMTLKEHKNLEDDEIAECVQEVGFKIANVLNKDLEKIKDVKEIERIHSGAVDIVNY